MHLIPGMNSWAIIDRPYGTVQENHPGVSRLLEFVLTQPFAERLRIDSGG